MEGKPTEGAVEMDKARKYGSRESSATFLLDTHTHTSARIQSGDAKLDHVRDGAHQMTAAQHLDIGALKATSDMYRQAITKTTARGFSCFPFCFFVVSRPGFALKGYVYT